MAEKIEKKVEKTEVKEVEVKKVPEWRGEDKNRVKSLVNTRLDVCK